MKLFLASSLALVAGLGLTTCGALPSDPMSATMVKSIGLPTMPGAMAVSPDGTMAYVVYQDSDLLTSINLKRMQIVRNVHLRGPGALTGVALDRAGELYLTSRCVTGACTDTVYVVNTRTLKELARIDVGGSSSTVSAAANGAEMYVTNLYPSASTGNVLSVIDVRSRSVTSKVPINPFPVASVMNPQNDRLYVATQAGAGSKGAIQGSLQIIDLANVTVLTTIEQNQVDPCALAVGPNGAVVYETLCGASSENASLPVLSLNTVTNQVYSFLKTDNGADGISTSTDGRIVFIGESGVLLRVNSRSGKKMSSVSVGNDVSSDLSNFVVSPANSELIGLNNGSSGSVFSLTTKSRFSN